jgi:hypothetical protein
MWKAQAEMNGMEIAMTAVLSDAGERDFSGLLNAEEFDRAVEAEMAKSGIGVFRAKTRVYSALAYALMKHGRTAEEALASSSDWSNLAVVLRWELRRYLGNSYMDEFDPDDPWGDPYQFYFGPWDKDDGICPLRIYWDDSPEAKVDRLTVTIEGTDGAQWQVGYEPPLTKVTYIWSFGENGESDQARFDSTGNYEPPASSHYRPDASPEFYGGGDDINNWDKNNSYTHFYPH